MGKKLYRSGDVLSITIAPSPIRQYFKEDGYKNRLNLIETEWTKEFYKWYQKSAIKSIQVWTEITWNGLIHYHGCVTIDDPREFASLMGQIKYPPRGQSDVNIDCDTIENMDTWLDYCRKDEDIMGNKLIIPLLADKVDAMHTLPPVARKYMGRGGVYGARKREENSKKSD